MKFVVIGGTGLIGSKVVGLLTAQGHQVLAAAPSSGVNTLTGEGLAEAMAGTDVVIDLANSPSFEDQAVLDFFRTSGRNLLDAEARAGVKKHVVLSVVGTEKLSASGYFRGKIAQEKLIRESGIPYTIIHSTQFFEFLSGIVKAGSDGQVVRLSPAFVQPIASDDVAAAVARLALDEPSNAVVEIAGPERERLSALAQRYMNLTGDTRELVIEVRAPYFGAMLEPDTLLPADGAWLGKISFQEWFQNAPPVPNEPSAWTALRADR